MGSGTGEFCRCVAERGATAAGIDSSEGMLKLARRKLDAADLRAGDNQALPWAGDSFDVVTAFNSFQFATDRDAVFADGPATSATSPSWAAVPCSMWGSTRFARPSRPGVPTCGRSGRSCVPAPPGWTSRAVSCSCTARGDQPALLRFRARLPLRVRVVGQHRPADAGSGVHPATDTPAHRAPRASGSRGDPGGRPRTSSRRWPACSSSRLPGDRPAGHHNEAIAHAGPSTPSVPTRTAEPSARGVQRSGAPQSAQRASVSEREERSEAEPRSREQRASVSEREECSEAEPRNLNEGWFQ